jgi:ABC-type thiamine transport system substrate-binding protein
MYPINNTVELPSCYEVSPVPAKTLTVDQAELEKAVEKVLAILAG